MKGRSSMPETRSAPWPDDMTCGETIANKPTNSPPTIVRHIGRSANREKIASHSATQRIIAMPRNAASRPTTAAST